MLESCSLRCQKVAKQLPKIQKVATSVNFLTFLYAIFNSLRLGFKELLANQYKDTLNTSNRTKHTIHLPNVVKWQVGLVNIQKFPYLDLNFSAVDGRLLRKAKLSRGC